MMLPRDRASESGAARPIPVRQTPLQVLHVLGNFMRIWSVYALYHHLSQSGDSVILFIFCCLVPASIIFLLLQKPWKGRPLMNSLVVPTIINGAIMALFLILWGKGLLSCGPLIILLAEYAGAVLGVLSALFYGRRVSILKKGSESNSIANLQFLSWAYLSTIFFGVVLIFYFDNLAEERLHLVFSSPRHLMVTTGCIIVMEISYKMDFSILGFLICSSVLAFGIFEATSLERLRRSPLDSQEISVENFENHLQMPSLPS